MYCKCGCGGVTPIAKKTRGDIKRGEHVPYIRGHWARGQRTTIEPPNLSGICQCGCGQPAPIATMTNVKLGHVAGHPVKFIRGHVGNLKTHTVLTPDLWTVIDRGYTTSCWIWNGHVNKKTGYTRVRFNGRYQLPHRVMYEQEVGPIPEGFDVDHLCFQRDCVRPEHLEATTRAENLRRARAAKTARRVEEGLARMTDADRAFVRTSSLDATKLAELYGVDVAAIERLRQ